MGTKWLKDTFVDEEVNIFNDLISTEKLNKHSHVSPPSLQRKKGDVVSY